LLLGQRPQMGWDKGAVRKSIEGRTLKQKEKSDGKNKFR